MKSKFNFNEVTERAKKALKIKTDLDFAEKINMKPAAFNRRKKAQSLPYEELLELADLQNIDFNWLLTGKGEMLKGEQPVKVYDRRADDVDNRIGKTERRVEKAINLLNDLSPLQQQEILAAIEEKKRINELERLIKQLAAQWEQDHQHPA